VVAKPDKILGVTPSEGTAVVVPLKVSALMANAAELELEALFLQITMRIFREESDFITRPDDLKKLNTAPLAPDVDPSGAALATPVPVTEGVNPVKVVPPSVEYPAAKVAPEAYTVLVTEKLIFPSVKLLPETGATLNSM
jgi:hypothetical protein